MASGSDAAKNVSHLVSLDSSFSSLPDVVREGRRVINNLQRTSTLFLVKTMFAIVVTILFLTNIFKTSSSYPFSTNNMYLWEWLCIGLGALCLSLQPNNEQIKSKFLVNVLFRLVPAAIVQIGLVVFFFAFYKNADVATACSVISFSVFSLIYFIRTCLPFDPYRLVLSVGLILIEIILIVLDRFALTSSFFKIGYSALNGPAIWSIVITLLVGTCIYFGLSLGASKLQKIVDKNLEEKK
jgi:cation-transporting ATPase E